MGLPKVAALIADRLNATGVKWIATGSIAAMSYGEYRVTNDIDVVLTLAWSDIEKLTGAFPLEEFYCPPADVIRIKASREEHGHFNVIHHETGFKTDVYLAGKDALTSWALRQRRAVALGDSVVWVAPPEYVIIGKLEFYPEGGSEKHVRDIRGMLAVTEVDLAFREREIAQRGLGDLWQKCL